MACHTAFNTTELLESILLFVPLTDLLRAQGVCKQWQRVITNSTILQEQLFFRPRKRDRAWLVEIINLPSGLGPLPRRYNTGVRIKASVPLNSAELEAHSGLLVSPVRVNSLCLCRLGRLSNLDMDANHGTPIVFHSKFSALKYQETGSWQDMFLTQPPVQYVTLESGSTKASFFHIIAASRHNIDSNIATAKIFVENGVRVRHIISELDKMRKSDSRPREEHAIYMHGCIAVTDDDEDTIKNRTKQWQNGEEYLSNLSIV